MTVNIDPIWPWSQLTAGDTSDTALNWTLAHSVSLLLVVVPLALVALTAWTYFNAGASRRRVLAVLALRLLAFLLAIACILRPSLGLADKNAQRGLLIVEVDSSESMTILDEIDNQSRWAYVQKLLKESRGSIDDLQDKENVDVEFYRFAGDTTRANLDDLGQADGKRTDIGGMLRTLYEKRDQRRLLGLLVLSDGADNGKANPPALMEAVRWRNLPCPVHTFGFGNAGTSDRTRDIIVTAIATQPAAPAPVPVKGLLTVTATIDAPGFENSRVSIKFFLDDKEVKAIPATLALTRGNEVKLTTNHADKPGEIKVTVRVEVLPGEAIVTNNEISTYVTVSKEGLRVLLVDKIRDGEPQSISDALSRDARIRVTNVWLSGDAPRLDPDTAALLDCDKNPYDVIIIGDVSASQLKAANLLCLPHIHDHVEKGAGLLMIGGYNSFGGKGEWATVGNDIGKLLPVELSVQGEIPGKVEMVPTEPGKRLYMMHLTEGKEDPWPEINKRPLEAAWLLSEKRSVDVVVLARANDEKATPLLVMKGGAGGRVLAFGGDTTYRWKRSSETRALQQRFWQRMAIWLAKQDEAEGSVWVVPDARRLPIRSDLGFTFGMKSKAGAALDNGTYKVKVIDPNGAAINVTTTRNGSEQRGTFTKADAPGEYRIEVSGEGKDDKGDLVSDTAAVRFLVYDEDVEMQRRAADHDFLKKLSSAGGGQFHQADELPGFLRDLHNKPDSGLRPKPIPYPNWRTTGRSPFLGVFFVLFVMVVSGEWYLRRRWGMV